MVAACSPLISVGVEAPQRGQNIESAGNGVEHFGQAAMGRPMCGSWPYTTAQIGELSNGARVGHDYEGEPGGFGLGTDPIQGWCESTHDEMSDSQGVPCVPRPGRVHPRPAHQGDAGLVSA